MLPPAGPQSPKPGYPPTALGTGQLPPQTMLADRYIILRRVGRGGMGAVYQAADARIPGKTWAVKEMSDAAITNPLDKQQAHAAFRQEALMLASLDHVNLPKVTDHFTEGSKQYLVMDFIEGETLASRLEREDGGPLPVNEVLDWAGQLCDVLEYLHSRHPPVVFRDLKPGNVMVTPNGLVKLIDFGIARIFKRGQAADTAYFGTAGYAPREQYGKGQTDARSDVYALGATLHHLLTGIDPTDHPFCFEDVRELNSQVPTHLVDAVMKALADGVSDRWQSVAEMRTALTEQVPGLEPVPASESRPKVSPPPRPAAVAAAGAPQPLSSASIGRGPASVASRLTLWRGAGLVLLGAVLQGGGAGLAADVLWDYVDFPLNLFGFVPALFGALFGPWVGGCVGALGMVIWCVLTEEFWPGWWGIAFGHFALGALPGLMVKDVRRWKVVLGAGIVASVTFALVVAVTVGVLEGWWDDFWYIAGQSLTTVLPLNVLVLPLLARWLAGLAYRRESGGGGHR